jgi:hypothetical protein
MKMGSYVFNERHLYLLSEKECCAAEDLLKAWTEWYKLSLYQNGEAQRRELYYGARSWGQLRYTWSQI